MYSYTYDVIFISTNINKECDFHHFLQCHDIWTNRFSGHITMTSGACADPKFPQCIADICIYQNCQSGVNYVDSSCNLYGIYQIERFMGPTWGPPGFCRPQMGPLLAPWTLLLWDKSEWKCFKHGSFRSLQPIPVRQCTEQVFKALAI